MAKYGYARVSTNDQDLSIQITALEKAGCGIVRSEKITGTTRQGRDELDNLLQFIREGDSLVVTRVDRLARSVKDLQDIVHTLKHRNAYLEATEQPIDTSTPAGKAFLDMLGVFAEFETAIRRERQMEGIAKAKSEGKYKGRKPTAKANAKKALELRAEGMKVTHICRELGISRSSFYRIEKEAC